MTIYCLTANQAVVDYAAALNDPRIAVRDPAAFGSLEHMDLHPADTVVFIDGCLPGQRPLLHKELLAELSRGVRIVGAGGVGAIRAAETERFGMEGVGLIFRLYRSGALSADDEVYVDDTVALVNARWTTRSLIRRGLLTHHAGSILVATAQGLPWYERTWENIVASARQRHPQLASDLDLSLLLNEGTDLIAADAKAAIDHALRSTAPQHNQQFDFADTLGYHEAHSVIPPASSGGDVFNASQVLAVAQALANDFPQLYQRVAVRTLLLADEPSRHAWCGCRLHGTSSEPTLNESERAELDRLDAVDSGQYGDVDSALEQALVNRAVANGTIPWRNGATDPDIEAQWLDRSEMDRLDPVQRAARVVVRAVRTAPFLVNRKHLVLELKRIGQFGKALEKLRSTVAFNRELARRNPAHVAELLRDDDIASWFIERWGDGNTVARWSERGYCGQTPMVEAVRRLYFIDRFGKSPDAWYLFGVATPQAKPGA